MLWVSASAKRIDFNRFTITRFARVYPVHVAMLLAVLLIFSVSG